jgi:uncharacterized protein
MLARLSFSVFLFLVTISCSPGEKSYEYVTDRVGILKAEDKEKLSSEMAALEKQIGSQLAILIIDSTDGESLEEFSLKTANEWKLGRKDIDDGVLIVVSTVDRQVRIEVGEGLEKVISDPEAGKIIGQYITPAFRQEKYFEGLFLAVMSIKQRIQQNQKLVEEK